MQRQRWLMLAVALGFGLLGVLAGRLIGDHPGLAPDSVQTDVLWQARLPDLEGRDQDLSQWQGKVLVLNFWAPWCPPCRREIPGFIRLQDRYASQGVQFVGVALDEVGPVRAYTAGAGINYPILLGGPGGALLGRAAGNVQGGLPYTLVLDRLGRPAASLVGAVSERRLEEILRPLL